MVVMVVLVVVMEIGMAVVVIVSAIVMAVEWKYGSSNDSSTDVVVIR